MCWPPKDAKWSLVLLCNGHEASSLRFCTNVPDYHRDFFAWMCFLQQANRRPTLCRLVKKTRRRNSRLSNYLDKKAVGDIVPMSQLLKSARDWKKCRAEAFTMPPIELWSNIVPTLLVVKKFKSAGMLISPMAASVYRNPILNACAGGSLKSKHLQLNAIDFDIKMTPNSLETLCKAWSKQGPELMLGLGFYTPSRIHLDTLGHRSWGSDFTYKTSLCTQTESSKNQK